MAISHRRKFLIGLSIPILFVGLFLALGLPYLLRPEYYRHSFQKLLTDHIGREVTFGRATIGFWGGLGIALDDFRIRDRSKSYDLLQAQRLIVTAKTLPLLLRRELRWKRLTLEKPVGRFHRDRTGRLNFLDAPSEGETLRSTPLKMVETFATLFGGTLTLRSGEFSFNDESFEDGPFLIVIRNLDLRLSKIARDKPFPFRVTGEVLHGPRKGTFSLSGTMEGLPEDFDLLRGKVRAEGELKGIEVSHFWPYLKRLLPMKRIAGVLDLKAKYQGSLSGPFIASAKLQLREVTYDHPQAFAYVFHPKWIQLEVNGKYDNRTLEIPALSIELPEIKLRAKGRIYGVGTKEMGMEAMASSNVFDLAEGRRFIPFRIITPKVSDPLFRAEGSGQVQILSVRVSGKIPEIDHCDEPKNAHVLSVEMKVHNARLKLPWNLPPLEELKGHLLFKQGHLHLKEVAGRVFHSKIEQAEGIFYELLQVPTLEVRGQGQFQMADLPALLQTEVFAEDRETSDLLGSLSSLSGTANYQLQVRGRLKSPLKFKHQGSYHLFRVRLVHPQIPFPLSIGEGKVGLSNEEVEWSEVKMDVGTSSLLLHGSIKRGGPFEVSVRGKIDLPHLHSLIRSPLFPQQVRLKAEEIQALSGSGQASFRGGRPAPLQPFSYEFHFAPKEATLLFKGATQPIHLREGTFSLSNAGATCSKLKIQFLNSTLLLDGTVRENGLNLTASGSIHLKNISDLAKMTLIPKPLRTLLDEVKEPQGNAELRLHCQGRMEQGMDLLKEGEIVLKGVSFGHRALPVPLSWMEGKVLFSSQQIRLEGMRGKLGDSPVHLSLGISRLMEGAGETGSTLGRRVQIHLASSQLHLDPIFPEREDRTPLSFEKVKEWLSRLILEGRVEIEKGRYRGVVFQDLKFEMKTVNGRLTIRPFEIKANGGMLWGEAWVQPSRGGIQFEMRPRLSYMEAPPLLHTLLKKVEGEKVPVTGRLSIDQVLLAGEGGNFQEIKESLQGRLRFELENGVIERANILSKIFSLLNVSQLFKGRLPDLKTRGLPYHRITATFKVKEGVAFTEDFLVDSDAMRITAIGKVDFGKNRIDAKVGIHPLGTVDTILSHIPIAGYILTGKDRAFLSYFYEVKGDLDDPVIEAIPFKMIGEGVVGLFKRLLETPLRPFLGNNSDKK
ncbi:MAG: AsmA-like C-terminal domain-containing protein [Desulfobacterota bacterium]|nr:AsmA-like C-terminal domain-containing protein [Thermodesulfobacteriota bacterium]